MNASDDWRLRGQETYLKGVSLIRQPWKPADPVNDHDHCEFCREKFMHHEGCLHAGYSTLDRRHWICDACFRDFSQRFQWMLQENPTGALRSMTALYITRGDELLLLYRIGSRVVGNSYTGTAGGHMEPDEISSARACVLRELQEETGLTSHDIEDLTMRYVTLRLKNGEIRQNYYFFASLKDADRTVVSNEGRLEWHAMDALEDLPMPHTARQMLRHYIATGRHTDLLYGAVSTADDTVFTPLTEF